MIEAFFILVFVLYVASLIHVWSETKEKKLGNPITTTLMVAICFWPPPISHGYSTGPAHSEVKKGLPTSRR
ncbi:MAG: hypothetical protein HC904_12740 [Blastochloris sp.]|nr:hypothetical protein [Blastochloris sp.]